MRLAPRSTAECDGLSFADTVAFNRFLIFYILDALLVAVFFIVVGDKLFVLQDIF